MLSPELEKKLEAARQEIRDEYLQSHTYPWIVGFSGGKDSTLVLHLVCEVLLGLPRSGRVRRVHVVSNDTQVESPLVMAHVKRVHETLAHAVEALNLPVSLAITTPELDHTFWVNLIGRGYPPPNRNFRWCTDRMKIQPTSIYVRRYVSEAGQVILLLGVRRSESGARAASAKRYGDARLNPHNDLGGCLVFRPILDFSTDEVWEVLGARNAPWGGRYQELIALYRNADGGECPVVTQKSDVPSCGTSSSRFGCWTCTVVEKDKSLEGFVDAGFGEFVPLLEFREWLLQIRDDPTRRSARRRDGKYTLMSNGTLIPGPFTLSTRREILDELLRLQATVGVVLIQPREIERIRRIWAEDAARGALLTARTAEVHGEGE